MGLCRRARNTQKSECRREGINLGPLKRSVVWLSLVRGNLTCSWVPLWFLSRFIAACTQCLHPCNQLLPSLPTQATVTHTAPLLLSPPAGDRSASLWLEGSQKWGCCHYSPVTQCSDVWQSMHQQGSLRLPHCRSGPWANHRYQTAEKINRNVLNKPALCRVTLSLYLAFHPE